jgi:hypothetical protein
MLEASRGTAQVEGDHRGLISRPVATPGAWLMYSAIPVPVARGPPQPDQWILLTRPVGSPPLKMGGLLAEARAVGDVATTRRPSTGRAGWLASEAAGLATAASQRIIAAASGQRGGPGDGQ